MPIYFKLSCHTIDRGCFELSFIYHTIDKTSSFTVIPSLTWLLVYSWCTIRLSGLRIPIFSNERANSSRQFTLHFLVVQSTRVVLNGDFYIKRQKRLQALRWHQVLQCWFSMWSRLWQRWKIWYVHTSNYDRSYLWWRRIKLHELVA